MLGRFKVAHHAGLSDADYLGLLYEVEVGGGEGHGSTGRSIDEVRHTCLNALVSDIHEGQLSVLCIYQTLQHHALSHELAEVVSRNTERQTEGVVASIEISVQAHRGGGFLHLAEIHLAVGAEIHTLG